MADSYKNLRHVQIVLEDSGWKVNERTLYRHVKAGKLLPESDGSYSPESVKKYAATHLLRTATMRHLGEDDLQRKKLTAEIVWKTEQAKREQIRRMADEGEYYPREDIDQMLAGRWAILNAGLEFAFQTKAPNLVAAVGGDHNRVEDLVHLLMEIKNEALNEFAAAGKEFHVILEDRRKTKKKNGRRGKRSIN